MFICASFQAPSHTILQVYDELPIVLPLPITSPFSVFSNSYHINVYHPHWYIIYIYISTFRYYLKVYGIYWSTWIILDTILRLCIYVIRPQFAIYDDINVMSIHHHPPHSSAPAPCICPPCPSKSGPRRVAVEGSGRCVHPGATDQGWWIWWQWVNVAWKWRLKRMAFFRVMKHI